MVSPEDAMSVAFRNWFTLQSTSLCSQGDEYRLNCGILISFKASEWTALFLWSADPSWNSTPSSPEDFLEVLNLFGGNWSAGSVWLQTRADRCSWVCRHSVYLFAAVWVVTVGLWRQSQVLHSWHFLLVYDYCLTSFWSSVSSTERE